MPAHKIMKTKLIQEPVFHSFVILMWGCSEDEWIKYLDKHWNVVVEKRYDEGRTVFDVDNTGVLSFIWIENENLIHHEASHLVFAWMRYKGIEILGKTEEVFCYLSDFYTKEITKAMKKKARKKRKSAKKKGGEK